MGIDLEAKGDDYLCNRSEKLYDKLAKLLDEKGLKLLNDLLEVEEILYTREGR